MPDVIKLAIVAATGGVGRQVLSQALAAGHDVTAVVRNPQRLTGSAARVVRCDLADPRDGVLEDAVATQDTVTQLIAGIRRVRREVPGAVEVVRQPRDPRQHLQGRGVEPGALALPRRDQPVDLVSRLAHAVAHVLDPWPLSRRAGSAAGGGPGPTARSRPG